VIYRSGSQICESSQGAFKTSCDTSSAGVAGALNQLGAGGLTDSIGNQALTTGLADRFDILVTALTSAHVNAAGVTTVDMDVTLVGADIPLESDLQVVCQIVTFTLSRQLDVPRNRIACSLEEKSRGKGQYSYVAKMKVGDSSDDLATSIATSSRHSMVAIAALLVLFIL